MSVSTASREHDNYLSYMNFKILNNLCFTIIRNYKVKINNNTKHTKYVNLINCHNDFKLLRDGGRDMYLVYWQNID